MKITKTEINKHIKETKALIEGVYGRTNLNKNWDIIFHVYWEKEDRANLKFDLVSTRELSVRAMLYDLEGNEKSWFIEDNYNKIESKIYKTKEYQEVAKRIKEECLWGSKAEENEDFNWNEQVLLPAEDECFDLPY